MAFYILSVTLPAPADTNESVRFLKTPKVLAASSKVTLQATITITTDLGETYYNDDISLLATLRSPGQDSHILLRRTLEWSAGMRALPLTFEFTASKVDWPVRLQVGLKGKHGLLRDSLESFDLDHELPSVISAWSEPLYSTKGAMQNTTRVQRRFNSRSEVPLTIFEDTGESIARHLWYVKFCPAILQPTARSC